MNHPNMVFLVLENFQPTLCLLSYTACVCNEPRQTCQAELLCTGVSFRVFPARHVRAVADPLTKIHPQNLQFNVSSRQILLNQNQRDCNTMSKIWSTSKHEQKLLVLLWDALSTCACQRFISKGCNNSPTFNVDSPGWRLRWREHTWMPAKGRCKSYRSLDWENG